MDLTGKIVLTTGASSGIGAACAGATVLITLGLMVATGNELNMVSSALPPLLWVLALGNCIHVLQRYQSRREREPVDDAVRGAVAEATRPCSLAALTTALGFLSLVVADMAPVREVGLFAAIGLVVSLPVNLVLGPELIRVLRLPARRSVARVGAGWSSGLVLRRPRTVLAVALVAAVLAIATLPMVRAESNPITFLPTDHGVTRAYRSVGQRLAGFYSLEVILETTLPWTDPRLWPVVDGLADRMAASPVVAKVLSPLDLVLRVDQNVGSQDIHFSTNAGGSRALTIEVDGDLDMAVDGAKLRLPRKSTTSDPASSRSTSSAIGRAASDSGSNQLSNSCRKIHCVHW